jgi:hypothetical protein
LAAQAQAASNSAAIVKGLVVDASEGRIAGASVLVGSGRQNWTHHSDELGEFEIRIPAGTYSFLIERDGFKKLLVTNFIIREGSTVSYKFSMEAGACADCDVMVEMTPIETTISSPELALSLRLPSPQSAPNIGVNGYASTDKVQRGRIVQVAVVMDIPHGYHVNSNRPLESFLKATQLKVEAPGGVRTGQVAYPRALLRKFSFSNDKLSVYEGRAVLRFNVTVPANFGSGSLELKAKLNYQSCSDALCFPPQSREVKLQIPVVGATESVKRINSEYFGRGR